MHRSIVGFHLDPAKDWVAELDCGHRQHVRHDPPFQMRPWVQSEEERAARLGTPLDCPLCDRHEMPEGLRLAWCSPDWDARSVPAGLRRAHKVAPGRWGRLVVVEGGLTYRAGTDGGFERVLGAGESQAIPPGVEHEVDPAGDARFFVELLDVVPYGG